MSTQNNNETAPSEAFRLQRVIDVSAALDQVNDLDSLLDRILTEARAFTHADSGTIYLRDGDSLRFAYNAHSASLPLDDTGRNRYNYLNHTIPIDERSIAGYVALTGNLLVINDAYKLDSTVPYSFNPRFDQEANYRTVSMLTIPLKSARGRIVGVLQLINALDRETARPVPFSEDDILYVLLFGKDVAAAVERATLTRRIILRMIRMSELRDPKETGAHVNRVAAYSVEIYQRWAELHGIGSDEVRRNCDLLRLAAMMHDVGKIAIPDGILKKPGPLSDSERAVMQTHAVVGARLFSDADSPLDQLAAEITLNHHERWDGTGYPGRIEDIQQDPIVFGAGKRGAEIPLFARIVGLADVYDALVSRRTYKEPWDEKVVLETIGAEGGKHFDPEIITAFNDVHPVLMAIRNRYTELTLE
ncbi:MAG TPA: HD domain-containing phosphohydrolase [Spirochaetia bacterium]|nr:HD domain-containing phosphohydrolase [Spirochaetia bacterium]